jgi:hypothetical protein
VDTSSKLPQEIDRLQQVLSNTRGLILQLAHLHFMITNNKRNSKIRVEIPIFCVIFENEITSTNVADIRTYYT